jgi:hypothetical protein
MIGSPDAPASPTTPNLTPDSPPVLKPPDVLPPLRISRTGSLLVASGVILIAAGFFLLAEELYLIFSRVSIQNFQQTTELYAAGQAILTALGIVLVGTGWSLDQRAIDRAVDPRRLQHRSIGMVAGLVILAVGVGLIAGYGLFSAYLDLSAYYQIQLNLSWWTEVDLEVMLGTGVLLVGLGWFVHHLGGLTRLENRLA